MSTANQTASKSPPAARKRRRGKNIRPVATANTRVSGGRYAPLTPDQQQRIHQAALSILDTIGIAEMPDYAIKTVLDNGGRLCAGKRVCFPRELVERALGGVKKDIVLHGRKPGQALTLGGKNVYTGTGGAAPLMIDLDTGEYRDSTLLDLYNAARLVDTLDNVHFFSRSMVARDMPDALSLDVNTAYACLAGTSKHILTSVSTGANVQAVSDICFTLAGSEQAFLEAPFLSLNINHVVSPLRFSAEACDVLTAAARIGIPVHVNTFAQLGASSPVTIAGCLAQTMAESLAGLIYAWLVNPSASVIFGPRPMVTDLRTGAVAGGSGEQALLTAAAAQMSQFYGLPDSTIAGASDSKIADAQSGYEKCLSVSLAAQTGCNLITQACGMQAGLMACSFESYVIDNDMLGAILRSMSKIDVSDTTLDVDTVRNVVNGDGHYLGQSETLKRMQTDFLYPDIADRRDHAAWATGGSPDSRSVANARARQILQQHYPKHISDALDTVLRAEHRILLPRDKMTGP